MAMSTGACWGGHFCVEPGIFVSNRAFLCRTMHFAVEPGFFVSNEWYNIKWQHRCSIATILSKWHFRFSVASARFAVIKRPPVPLKTCRLAMIKWCGNVNINKCRTLPQPVLTYHQGGLCFYREQRNVCTIVPDKYWNDVFGTCDEMQLIFESRTPRWWR